MNHQKYKTLYEWENELSEQIEQIDLLGEIGMSRSDFELMTEQFKRCFDSDEKRLIRFTKIYPCTFAMYLVAHGIYHYNQEGSGEYWKSLKDLLDIEIPPKEYNAINDFFLAFLEEHDLSKFPDMEGRKYVNRILMHGLIPKDSLPDFFLKVLKPIVTKNYYHGMHPAEIISEMAPNFNNRLVNKPTQNFLIKGGKIAEGFLSFCQNLAQHFLAGHTRQSPEDAMLPAYVVNAFYRWAEDEQNLTPKSDRRRTEIYFHRPRIMLDIDDKKLTMEFPAQSMSVEYEIYADKEKIKTFDVYRYCDETHDLERPAQSYKIILKQNNTTKRTWHFEGINHDSPLMAFDAEKQTLLNRKPYPSLPKRELWLLYHHHAKLDILRGTLNDKFKLSGDWEDYRVELWDLTHATKLNLIWHGKSYKTNINDEDEVETKPHLIEGTLCSDTQNDIPLYLDSPPMLKVPLSQSSKKHRLHRWQLTIRSEGNALPNINHTFKLSNFSTKGDLKDYAFILPLDLPELLDKHPMGKFHIFLRHGSGQHAELTFCVVPMFKLKEQHTVYLPNRQKGHENITLQTELPHGLFWENQTDSQSNALKIQYDKIIVPPDVNAVHINLVKPIANGNKVIRVPITFPLYRLQWRWVIDDTKKAWQATQTTMTLAEFEQVRTMTLHVNLTATHVNFDVIPIKRTISLQLLDSNREQCQMRDYQIRHKHAMWKFDIIDFRSTIQASQSPYFYLNLACHANDEEQTIPLLKIEREFKITHVKLTATHDKKHVTLTWQGLHGVRHFHVRLWQVVHCWFEPHEIEIPLDTHNSYTLQIPNDKFLEDAIIVEFFIKNPYNGQEKTTPPTLKEAHQSPRMTIIEMPKLPTSKRYRRLVRDCPERFYFRLQYIALKIWLEKRTYFGYEKQKAIDVNTASWQSNLKKTFEYLDNATFSQLLALVIVVKEHSSDHYLVELQKELFNPYRIKQVLLEYQSGKIEVIKFHKYFDFLPNDNVLSHVAYQRLLDVPLENVPEYAVKQLLKSNFDIGIAHVLTTYQNDNLSLWHAVTLLKENLKLAIDYLQPKIADDIRALHLLMELDETLTNVRKWVYTLFGENKEDGYNIVQFIKLDVDTGIEEVVNWYCDDAISLGDACHVFDLNRELAIDYLLKHFNQPAVFGLLEAYSPDSMPIVKVGYWVYCDAGWGRVDKIMQNNEPIEYFDKAYPKGIILHVTLRPEYDNHAFIITLPTKKLDVAYMDLQIKRKAYHCCKDECKFITFDRDILERDHLRHAHQGIGLSLEYRRYNKDYQLQHAITFNAQPPENELI